MSLEHPADLLLAAIARTGTCACVGIDPAPDLMPAELASIGDSSTLLRTFSAAVIDASAGIVPAVKFQSACFERFGWQGVRELEQAMHKARSAGLIVILDAKRGDIGSTSAHYAAAAVNAGAHWITANGYLGTSGLEPFAAAGLGMFVLVRTSNPDSDEIQSNELAAPKVGSVAEHMASVVARLGSTRLGASGLSAVGAVVGATKPADGAALRRIMPDQFFLIPGYGAQGGTIDDIRTMRRPEAPGRGGILVNASRSVTYPKGDGPWAGRVRDAVKRLADDLRGVA
jgi:orotidine-5'-phosphate decarboxylase